MSFTESGTKVMGSNVRNRWPCRAVVVADVSERAFSRRWQPRDWCRWACAAEDGTGRGSP